MFGPAGFGACVKTSPRRSSRKPSSSSVGTDGPGQLEPEFVLFPNFARIYFACVIDRFTCALANYFHDGLTKTEPLRIVRFVRVKIVSFGADAHRQNVVSVISSFVPRWSQRDIATNEIRITQHLDPRKAVRVGPYRVVDAREVNIELCPAVF